MGLQPGEALRATAAVCEARGLRPSGFVLLRASSYTVVRIAGTPYLARVGEVRPTHARHGREMAIARTLGAAGAPVAQPAPLPQPLVVDGACAVGLWCWEEEVAGARLAPAVLGGALRAVHDAATGLDQTALGVPDFVAPGRAHRRLRRLAEQGHLEPATASELAALIDELACSGASPVGLTHGDFRRANVLATAGGPVVIDFDAASIAPLAWDLTLPAQQHRRFGLPASDLEAFLAAYGGVADAEEFERLCRLRDVVSAVWAVGTAVAVPGFAAEARRRLESVRDPCDRSPWSWDGLPSARP